MKFSLFRALVFCLAVDWAFAGQSSDSAKQVDQTDPGHDLELANGRTAEFSEMRRRRIEAAVRKGRIGPVEGELMTLLIPDGRDPRARREEISGWRAENAAALAAERAEKRARGDMARSEVRAARAWQIAEAEDSGRIGTLEAEFMTLVNRDFENPRTRAAAIREWRKNKGGALAAEKRARHAEETDGEADRLAGFRNRRGDQIAEAVASGRVGPPRRRTANTFERECRRSGTAQWERPGLDGRESRRSRK